MIRIWNVHMYPAYSDAPLVYSVNCEGFVITTVCLFACLHHFGNHMEHISCKCHSISDVIHEKIGKVWGIFGIVIYLQDYLIIFRGRWVVWGEGHFLATSRNKLWMSCHELYLYSNGAYVCTPLLPWYHIYDNRYNLSFEMFIIRTSFLTLY